MRLLKGVLNLESSLKPGVRRLYTRETWTILMMKTPLGVKPCLSDGITHRFGGMIHLEWNTMGVDCG